MQTSILAARCCPWSLLLALGGACGSPSSSGGGEPPARAEPAADAGKAADAEGHEPAPAEPEPTEPPAPDDAPRLVVDAKQPEPDFPPLKDVPAHACHEAAARPLRCGLAAACKELAERWVTQLDVGKSAQAHVAGLAYPEAPCPDPVRWTRHDDFARNAIVLRHRLEVLVDDEVAELWTRTAEGWRSMARITEVAATGMASQRAYRPVASWQLELQEGEGEDLVVLVRGRDSGHAAKADPFTHAWAVVCDGRRGECRRLPLGQWLEGEAVSIASPAQREAAWSGVLRIHADDRFELDADEDRHDRTLGFEGLEPARAPLSLR